MSFLSDLLNQFVKGDKKYYFSILSVVSCICPSTLYLLYKYKESMSMDTLKFILLSFSLGVTTFLIFEVLTFILFTLKNKLIKNYESDTWTEFLLFPALYNFCSYIMVILEEVESTYNIYYSVLGVHIIAIILFVFDVIHEKRIYKKNND